MKTKLTKEQVIDIYNSKQSYSVICSKYLLSKGYVSAIRNGRNLKHITQALEPKKKIKRGKLTDEQRDLIRTSDDPIAVLAEEYGVSKTNIYQLRSRYKLRRK